MENANHGGERVPASQDLEDFLNELLGFFKKYVPQITLGSLLMVLFKDGSNPSSIYKINEKGRVLNGENIAACMDNLYSYEDEEEGFLDFASCLPAIIRQDSEDTLEHSSIDLETISLNYNKFLSEIYERYDPYPWIDLDELALEYEEENDDYGEGEVFISSHQLVYLISCLGLRTSGIKNTKAHYIETEEDDTFLQLYRDNIKEGNKRFISVVSGTPGCGKTCFLKHLTIKNNSRVFYMDAADLTPECILKIMRPDYIFWNDSDVDTGEFVNPWDKCLDSMAEMLTQAIPEEFTLIIDNISDPEQVKDYIDILPCNIVLVGDPKGFEAYRPDYVLNMEVRLPAIFNGLCSHQADPLFVDQICRHLGTNLYVYKLVALNYLKMKETTPEKADQYLNLLAIEDEIEPLNSELKNFNIKTTGSINNKSSGQYLGKFIEHIYEENLSSGQQRLLHLLYRCQLLSEGKISLTRILPFLDSGKYEEPLDELTDDLINLGWLKDDSLEIPVVIAASLNNISCFKNADYTLFLDLMMNFSGILKGLSDTAMDPEACFMLVQAIHRDFQSFIKEKGEESAKELNKIFFSKLKKKEYNTPDKLSRIFYRNDNGRDFRRDGFSEESYDHPEDPIGDSQFKSWLIVKDFYLSAIYFCYQYNNAELAGELHTYASALDNILYRPSKKKPLLDYDWKIQMQILSPDNINKPGFSHISFTEFSEWPEREPRDNKYLLMTMSLKVIYDSQRIAARLWEHELSGKYAKSPDLRMDDQKECFRPFVEFLDATQLYNISWPENEKDGVGLFLMTGIYASIIASMVFQQFDFTSFPEESSSSELTRQCLLMYYASQIYRAAFITKDTDSIHESQDVLRQLLPGNGLTGLPVNLRYIVEKALSIG